MNRSEAVVLALVAATGVASVVVQLVCLREFLTLFQGNEFVIALILFCWLAWGGAGSLVARQLVSRPHRVSDYLLAGLSFLLAGLAPVQILGLRWLRDTVFLQGSSVGFYARVYISDNLGDTSGGALFAFALVYWATPVQAVALAQLPLLAATWRLMGGGLARGPWRWAAAAVVLMLLGGGLAVERSSLAVPLRGALDAYRETRFGRIEVYRDDGQVTLFKDGRPVTGSHQAVAAEEAVHYPLAQIDRVGRVLMISAESGMLEEVSRHRPGAIDYVELDPVLAELQFRYGLLKKVPGLTVITTDARRHLQTTAVVYDAIIMSLPEPDTFQVNRFFTTEFFRLAHRHLAPGGVLSFSTRGYDNYLAEAQRRKLACLYQSAALHFRHLLLIPGQRIFFLCRDQPMTADIPAALQRKEIATPYISGYFHGNVTPQRIDGLNRLASMAAPRNTDYAPRLMRLMLHQWFERFGTHPLPFVAGLGALLAIYLVRASRPEWVLFSTGFMTMGAEILVVFAFQILFGYIYLQIGLIVTVFLAGLMPGAWLGARITTRVTRALGLADLALMVLMVGLGMALALKAMAMPAWIFLVFGFLVSLACGFQFPLALRIKGGHSDAVSRFFAADLIGAAAGTLVTSTVLVPYFGIMGTIAGLVLLKGASLAILGGQRDAT